MARKKKEIDFPVFSVHGNYLQEEIEQAVNLRYAMKELTEAIEETGKSLKQIGQKLNLYLNNVITRDKPFDYMDSFVIFSQIDELSIYPHEVMDKIMDAEEEEGRYFEEEEVLTLLPDTSDRHKLNKKQAITCLELVDDYNNFYEEYESAICELEDCNIYYQCIIEEAKEHLSEIKLFDLKGVDNDDTIEPFDNEKHDLLIVRDTDTKKWKFVYLRKGDRDKFIEIVSKPAE